MKNAEKFPKGCRKVRPRPCIPFVSLPGSYIYTL